MPVLQLDKILPNEPSDHEPSDQILIIRSIEGQRSAFTMLMHRHRNWLHRFISRYVWNAEDAFDVLQEALAGAWLSLPNYDQTRPFNIWLRSIALNKCRDHARKNILLHAIFLPDIESVPIDDVIDPALTPEMSVEFKQAAKMLYKAIADLPRTLKEPLILTTLEGLSRKESADLLMINVKTVENRIYRAKQKLAQKLDPSQLRILLDRDLI